MRTIHRISHVSRSAGFSALFEADFTSLYKFVITVLQVSKGKHKGV